MRSFRLVLGKKWWGQGIMPEAGLALEKFLFEEVGFNRIQTEHDAVNPKSGRVMQKIGMTYEGTLCQAAVNNRGIIDIPTYSILREEFCSKKE